MINPLNIYGPYYPVTFEKTKDSSGSVPEEEIQEMIDKSLTTVAFISNE